MGVAGRDRSLQRRRRPWRVPDQGGSEGYPPDLDTLVKGVDVGGKKLRFLRRIPTDPMTNDTDWGVRRQNSSRSKNLTNQKDPRPQLSAPKTPRKECNNVGVTSGALEHSNANGNSAQDRSIATQSSLFLIVRGTF